MIAGLKIAGWAGLAGILVLSWSPCPARAQSGASPPETTRAAKIRDARQKSLHAYDPHGARLGTFLLMPKLSVRESYDDNLYLDDRNPTADIITTIAPRLLLRSDWQRHAVSLRAGAAKGIYGTSGDNNFLDYDIGGQIRLDDIAGVTVSGDAGFAAKHEDRGSIDNAGDAADPVQYRETSAAFSARSKTGPATTILETRWQRLDFDDNATLDGRINNNDDRDRQQWATQITTNYNLSPGHSLYIEGETNQRHYDQSVDDTGVSRDSFGYRAAAGIDIDLTHLIRARAGAGWMAQIYADPSLTNAAGYFAHLDLDWQMTRLTRISVHGARTIAETTVTGASSILGTRVGLGLHHALTRQIDLSAGTSISHAAYQGVSREDDTLGFVAGASYRLNPVLSMKVDLRHTQRQSTQSGNDYQQNILTLTLGAHL